MKILIEDAESLNYLTSSGRWSESARDGKAFGATSTALEAAKKELIGAFNIVCYISQTGQLVNLDHGRGKGAATGAA